MGDHGETPLPYPLTNQKKKAKQFGHQFLMWVLKQIEQRGNNVFQKG